MNFRFRHALVAFLSISLFVSCKSKNEAANTADDFLVQWLDSSLAPGEDFFRFATGNWMKNNPIPDAERRWGIGNLVQEEVFAKLRGLSEEAAADASAPAGSNRQRIGAFWSSGMDSATIENLGLKPLEKELADIDKINDINSLRSAIARQQMVGGSPLFDMSVFQDEMNSDRFTLHLYQGGLGLPDRDYYFNEDARTKGIREEYVLHIARILELTGYPAARSQSASKAIMGLETSLARVSRKLEELRDQYANYNKSSVSDFDRKRSKFALGALLAQMGLEKVDTVIVGQPEFFDFVEQSLSTVQLSTWKDYLRWNLVSGYSRYLSASFDQEHFRFYGTVLTGVKAQRPRWKRVLNEEEDFLGDALGQLYVEKFVSPNMKVRYQKLVGSMMETYAERIRGLDWMSDTTKQKALAKLSTVTSKVCYPDKWKDYSSLQLERGAYLANIMRCREWQFKYQTDKLFKPVDRSEWDMTPQTYNAYYNPSNNEIVLPAAIFLIPGLPDSLADDAIIYGYAAASTIGHEITHGFDDQGRQFDAKGNLSNWWTEGDSVRFASKAKLMIDQFSGYVVLDSMHVNGEASLGENIADLGGVVMGLEAFKKTEQYKSGKPTDGLTPVQRYFLGYSLGWLGHARDASLANQIMTDVHAPNFLRVNGPFSNIPEFYEAFGIKQGDKMWRPDSLRVVIW